MQILPSASVIYYGYGIICIIVLIEISMKEIKFLRLLKHTELSNWIRNKLISVIKLFNSLSYEPSYKMILFRNRNPINGISMDDYSDNNEDIKIGETFHDDSIWVTVWPDTGSNLLKSEEKLQQIWVHHIHSWIGYVCDYFGHHENFVNIGLFRVLTLLKVRHSVK